MPSFINDIIAKEGSKFGMHESSKVGMHESPTQRK